LFNLVRCPECGHTDHPANFIQDTNPPKNNSGVWCPKCEISLELKEGVLQYYIDIDESSIEDAFRATEALLDA